jgi:hypothetical protein
MKVEEYRLLGYVTVWCLYEPTFRKNISLPEDGILHNYRREILKSHKYEIL